MASPPVSDRDQSRTRRSTSGDRGQSRTSSGDHDHKEYQQYVALPLTIEGQYRQYSDPWNPQGGRDNTESKFIVNNVDEMFSDATRSGSPGEFESPIAEPHNGVFTAPLMMLNTPVYNQGRDTPRFIITSANSDFHPVNISTQAILGSVPSMTSGDTCTHVDFDDTISSSPHDNETHSQYSGHVQDFYAGPHLAYDHTADAYTFDRNECHFINPQLTVSPIESGCYQPSEMEPYLIQYTDCAQPIEIRTSLSEWDFNEDGSINSCSDDEDMNDVEMHAKTFGENAPSLISRKRKRVADKEEKPSPRGPKRCKRAAVEKKPVKKKTKERLKCIYQCNSTFHNQSLLRKHIQVKHERPFKCTFSFAGCDQSFGSKNEWKRHVTSQHMHLSCWQCDLPACKDRHALFNRKDLLGQHLKRMHLPSGKKVESWFSEAQRTKIMNENREQRDNWLREELPTIQDRCFTVWREAPSESNCEICGTSFSGEKSWDAKMEHVGKHYENGDSPSAGGPIEDKGLIKWALKHQLVEERAPYEESSVGSESSFDGRDDYLISGLYPSQCKMENSYKYQFTKHDPFLPKHSSQKHLPWSYRGAIDQEFKPFCSTTHYDALVLLDETQLNEIGPDDHDTKLLLLGARTP